MVVAMVAGGGVAVMAGVMPGQKSFLHMQS